ncbi:DUF3341 domain-containing protein [Methylocystis heyeri]|uniref:DUF3341 domain-containing protein n=1 Tax=Methylocystis heyeri TaxID=391905 RepID=A0A6B8KBD9_9HYPH|nr:DUF3341 domain-containing protein [Methylocystis heyeri]QGM44331.1 DUF3341 domain-containing protein [Methylocystis heyeri]
MTRLLVVDFGEPGAVLEFARRARKAHYEVIDIYSPFPVEGAGEFVGGGPTALRVHMFIGGVAVAALAYGVEAWSATSNYPIISGGRPLDSWPAFMPFPFTVGIFGAALTGFISLLIQTGLPRLHHPIFAHEGFERTTQDRFLLALKPPAAMTQAEAKKRLEDMGASNIRDME